MYQQYKKSPLFGSERGGRIGDNDVRRSKPRVIRSLKYNSIISQTAEVVNNISEILYRQFKNKKDLLYFKQVLDLNVKQSG